MVLSSDFLCQITFTKRGASYDNTRTHTHTHTHLVSKSDLIESRKEWNLLSGAIINNNHQTITQFASKILNITLIRYHMSKYHITYTSIQV